MRKVEIKVVRTLFDGYFRIDEAELRYELPGGRMSDLSRGLSFERGDSAAAVVVNESSAMVLLARQFRFPTVSKGPGWVLELVAGTVEIDESPDADGTLINFDEVYQELFLEPVGSLGFDVIRCDEIAKAGSIHKDMFTHIAMDDLALVGITTANPNVFYELGVRHALKPSITVLTKHRGAKVPFNIQGQRVIEYPSETGSWAASRAETRDFIANGLRENEPDSPIFTILQGARKDWKRERIDSLKERTAVIIPFK